MNEEEKMEILRALLAAVNDVRGGGGMVEGFLYGVGTALPFIIVRFLMSVFNDSDI